MDKARKRLKKAVVAEHIAMMNGFIQRIVGHVRGGVTGRQV
mgnify:CR=1 FL=1